MSEEVAMESESHIEWEEFVAGWGAGLSNVAITFPIHKLMFRQMLYGVPTAKAFQQLRSEGVPLLYRGLLPPLCQKTISVSIMFGSYDFYGSVLRKECPRLNEQFVKSCGAYLAGISEAVLAPLERIQTLLQDKHYNQKFHNTPHAIHHLWKHYGFTEFYRGGSTIVFRNSLSNVLFFASREHVQAIAPQPTSLWSKYILDFAIGGVIGGAISSVFYPVNVVKTRMQDRLGGNFEPPLRVLQRIYVERDRKLRRMFVGVHINYTRALMSWGIINASYELIKSLIHRFKDDTSLRGNDP